MTVLDPPQKSGGPELLLDKKGLQPPNELTSVSHCKYNESTRVCEVHGGAARIGGQLRRTGGAEVTVKTAEHVMVESQLLVAVKVTVTSPPQAEGADPPLLDSDVLHPPEVAAVVSQLLYLVSIWA